MRGPGARSALIGALASAGAALLIASAVPPAAARPWPDDPAQASGAGAVRPVPDAAHGSEGPAPLRRVGRQFVRGDNLTGAGVPAPDWIPELLG